MNQAVRRSRRRRWLLWLPAAGGFLLIALPVVLIGGVGSDQCAPTPAAGGFPAGGGSWIATAYGPPWGGIQGGGVTATGLNLTAGPPAYEIAVDPAVIPLESFAHVQPNPFGTTHAFYAGDTGGAIIGKHVDIYDWQGRAAQDAWGVRHVNVTPAPNPGTGNLLGEITPALAGTSGDTGGQAGGTAAWTPECAGVAGTATLTLVPGQQARILPDGSAAAPAGAPPEVKLAVAAANAIHTKPYPDPVAHYGSLAYPWPAYDCSGAVSYVLYKAGLHSEWPDVSGTLESWGLPGPGRWITVYANSGHTWVVIAGLAFDTADYGGPNIPAGTGPRWRQDPTGNLADGLSYVVRHPAGL
jgi:3D (Asp-Asp-Asp) domain-containing protein